MKVINPALTLPTVLHFLQRTGVPISAEAVTDVIYYHANNANIAETERIINTYMTG